MKKLSGLVVTVAAFLLATEGVRAANGNNYCPYRTSSGAFSCIDIPSDSITIWGNCPDNYTSADGTQYTFDSTTNSSWSGGDEAYCKGLVETKYCQNNTTNACEAVTVAKNAGSCSGVSGYTGTVYENSTAGKTECDNSVSKMKYCYNTAGAGSCSKKPTCGSGELETDAATCQKAVSGCCLFHSDTLKNNEAYKCQCGAKTGGGMTYSVDDDGKLTNLRCSSTWGHGVGWSLYNSTIYSDSATCNAEANKKNEADAHSGQPTAPDFEMSKIGETLTKDTLCKLNPLCNSSTVFKSDRSPGTVVSRLVKSIIFPIAGLLLFLYIVWGGFQVVQGGTMGSDNVVQNGKQRVTAAIIGFLLLFASYWMWSLVELALGLGTTG